MNSRERVLSAINHRRPDRVPLDLWAHSDVKTALCERLSLAGEEELLQYLGVDIRSIYPKYIGPELRQFSDGSYEDFWGVVRKPVAHAAGSHDEVCFSPLAEAATVRDIENAKWPSPDWFDYAGLSEECDRFDGYAVNIGRMGIESQNIFIQPGLFTKH